MQEIVIYGRGGQGTVIGTRLLVAALYFEGKYAQGYPSFGGERRGAPVRAFLRIDKEPIIIRGQIVHEADCVVVLDERLIELMHIASSLKPGGIAVLNTKRNPSEVKLCDGLSRIATIDATKLVESVFGPAAIPIINTAMLGAFSAATRWVDIENIAKAIKQLYTGDSARNNEVACRLGYKATTVFEQKGRQ